MRRVRVESALALALLLLSVVPLRGDFAGVFREADPYWVTFAIIAHKYNPYLPNLVHRQAQTQPPPAPIPFADGISNQSSKSSSTGYIRAADGSYVAVQFNPGPPLTLLSGTSQVSSLLGRIPERSSIHRRYLRESERSRKATPFLQC